MKVFDHDYCYEMTLAPRGWMMMVWRISYGKNTLEEIHNNLDKDPFKRQPTTKFEEAEPSN